LHRRSNRKKAMTMKVDRKEFMAQGYLYRTAWDGPGTGLPATFPPRAR
jgi:hypothetical protein